MYSPLRAAREGSGRACRATVATHGVLRRAAPGRGARWAALFAGAVAAITWVLFALELLFYSLDENRPGYYPHSDYEEYRRALDGAATAVAAGIGYALLAGSLVAFAEIVRRRRGPVAGAVAVVAALYATALPLVVPAALPRDEFGKDPVFYVSHAGNVEFQPYFPKVCFAYGVERSPAESVGRKADPTLQDELNESEVRPLDPVDADTIDIEAATGR
jgi:hypothetical protein